VVECGPHQLANVSISERVVDVLALAATLHDPLGVQEAKLLRECGELGLARCGELTDAAFPCIELMKQAKSSEVARGSKERSRAFEGRIAHLTKMRVGLRVWAAFVCVLLCLLFLHFNDC